jgi:hypothetical protein
MLERGAKGAHILAREHEKAEKEVEEAEHFFESEK